MTLRKTLHDLYIKWLYRNCPGHVVINGIDFTLDANDSLRLWRNKTYSPFVLETVLSHLPEGGTFVDAGASIGWFACNAAKQLDGNGRVIAVEPNPDQYAILLQNLRPFDNVHAVQMGLWSECGGRPLAIDAENGSGGRLFATKGRDTVPVQTITIDYLLQMLGMDRVDVVKMDCEGSEGAIVAGFKRMAEFKSVIVTEFTFTAMIAAGWSPVRFWQQLNDYGQVWYLDETKNVRVKSGESDSKRDGNYLAIPG